MAIFSFAVMKAVIRLDRKFSPSIPQPLPEIVESKKLESQDFDRLGSHCHNGKEVTVPCMQLGMHFLLTETRI